MEELDSSKSAITQLRDNEQFCKDVNLLDPHVREKPQTSTLSQSRSLLATRLLARALTIALRASKQGARQRFALFELDL